MPSMSFLPVKFRKNLWTCAQACILSQELVVNHLPAHHWAGDTIPFSIWSSWRTSKMKEVYWKKKLQLYLAWSGCLCRIRTVKGFMVPTGRPWQARAPADAGLTAVEVGPHPTCLTFMYIPHPLDFSFMFLTPVICVTWETVNYKKSFKQC